MSRRESRDTARPPSVAERLLRLLTRDADREALLGDLAEEHARNAEALGRTGADWRYRREVLLAALHRLARLFEIHHVLLVSFALGLASAGAAIVIQHATHRGWNVALIDAVMFVMLGVYMRVARVERFLRRVGYGLLTFAVMSITFSHVELPGGLGSLPLLRTALLILLFGSVGGGIVALFTARDSFHGLPVASVPVVAFAYLSFGMRDQLSFMLFHLFPFSEMDLWHLRGWWLGADLLLWCGLAQGFVVVSRRWRRIQADRTDLEC